MINKDYLKEELKNLSNRVVADKNWKREQRKLLLSQLNAQTDEVIDLESEKELHIFSSFKMLLKPVFLLLVFVLGSGYLGVMASEQSLPGDLLYSVKITSEKAKAGLIFDKNKKTKLHVELAQKRVDEIKQLKEQAEVANEPLAEELIEETYNKIKEEIQETKNILNVLKLENANGNFDNTTDLVKIVEHVDSSMKMITDYLAEMLDEDKKKELSEEKIKFLEKDMVQGILKDVKDLRTDVKIIIKEVVMKQADKLDQDYEVSEAISKIIGRSVSALNEKSDQLISDLNKEDLEVLVEEYADEYVNEYMNENQLLDLINERISNSEVIIDEPIEEITVLEQPQEEETVEEEVVEDENTEEEVVEEVSVEEETANEEEVVNETEVVADETQTENEEVDENIEENQVEVNNEEEITTLEADAEIDNNEEVVVEEDVLSVVKDLLEQENLVTSLEDSKQLVDVLNQEIFVLVENGEFDKALEYLEASEYIVANMTEESNEEVIVEEEVENSTEESEEVVTEENTTENTEEVVEEENTTETQTETTVEEEVVAEEPTTETQTETTTEETVAEEPTTETQTETTTEEEVVEEETSTATE